MLLVRSNFRAIRELLSVHFWMMNDMRFYVLFNGVSIISGRWEDDNESLVQWNPVYGMKDFRVERGSNSVR